VSSPRLIAVLSRWVLNGLEEGPRSSSVVPAVAARKPESSEATYLLPFSLPSRRPSTKSRQNRGLFNAATDIYLDLSGAQRTPLLYNTHMGTLSKVAAGAAALIPFHCVICFDEFNLADRVPMVLPCGHTYVCHRCTQRLSRCMECREPLFLSVPSSAFAAHTNNNPAAGGAGGGGRYSPLSLPSSSTAGGTSNHHHHHPYGSHQNPPPPHHHSTPPPAMVKIPLSIPKNVVLISLMEAAQRQVLESKQHDKQQKRLGGVDDNDDKRDKDRRQEGIGSNPNGEDDDGDESDDDSSAGSASEEEEEDDNEEFNLDRIISGMATLSGPCGTYAVTVDGQVVVQPNDPRGASSSSSSSSNQSQKRIGATATDPTSEEKKTDDPDAIAECRPAGSAKDADEDIPPKLQQPQLVLSHDDDAGSSEDGLPLSPIQSAGSYASRANDDDDDDDDDESDQQQERGDDAVASRREPFVLRKGQTVQIVALEDGVAKLARNRGYIVLGTSSHLVKGTSCSTICAFVFF
jgi:Zinc finger, C3HC4 type (RING finger)